MKSTLRHHLKAFGQIGHHTFHAGLSVEEAAAIGPDEVAGSMRLAIKEGDVVRIRGTEDPLVVDRVNGVFVRLVSFGDRSYQAFKDAGSKWGTYSYGRIGIYKAHLALEV